MLIPLSVTVLENLPNLKPRIDNADEGIVLIKLKVAVKDKMTNIQL